MSWSGIYNDPNPTYACSGQTFTYTTGSQLVLGEFDCDCLWQVIFNRRGKSL